jgi:hypothetical protein
LCGHDGTSDDRLRPDRLGSREWNVQHISADGLTIEEVEQIPYDPANRPSVSRSSGRPAVFGQTATGKDILVVYEVLETEPVTVIRPVTAYEPLPG